MTVPELDDLLQNFGSALKELGLTQKYQQKIFLIMCKHAGEKLTAEKISELTKVPFTRVHSILNEMAQSSIVSVYDDFRPYTYTLHDPKDAVIQLKDELEKELYNKRNQAYDLTAKFEMVFGKGKTIITRPMYLVAPKSGENPEKDRLYDWLYDFLEDSGDKRIICDGLFLATSDEVLSPRLRRYKERQIEMLSSAQTAFVYLINVNWSTAILETELRHLRGRAKKKVPYDINDVAKKVEIGIKMAEEEIQTLRTTIEIYQGEGRYNQWQKKLSLYINPIEYHNTVFIGRKVSILVFEPPFQERGIHVPGPLAAIRMDDEKLSRLLSTYHEWLVKEAECRHTNFIEQIEKEIKTLNQISGELKKIQLSNAN